jgi:hypothetical protein
MEAAAQEIHPQSATGRPGSTNDRRLSNVGNVTARQINCLLMKIFKGLTFNPEVIQIAPI